MRAVPEVNGRYDREWLHEFAMTTAEVIYSHVQHSASCILSTRVGVEVLERYGIRVRPQPVLAVAMNREAYLLVERGVPHSQWPDTAWSVGFKGTGASDPETNGWDGHLVLVLRNPDRTRTLVDLTAGQMDRAHRGLHMPDVVFMDLNGLWTPQDPLWSFADKDPGNPTIVSYAPLMTAGDWQSTPDWVRDQTKHVDEICERMDKVVA